MALWCYHVVPRLWPAVEADHRVNCSIAREVIDDRPLTAVAVAKTYNDSSASGLHWLRLDRVGEKFKAGTKRPLALLYDSSQASIAVRRSALSRSKNGFEYIRQAFNRSGHESSLLHPLLGLWQIQRSFIHADRQRDALAGLTRILQDKNVIPTNRSLPKLQDLWIVPM
jgi:hypothetical protein